MYDPITGTQKHFDKHTDDVTCMAFSSDRETVATGEIGKKPKIYIWDAVNMQIKHKITGKLAQGVKCMSFSPSGKLLAAVDSSTDHQVAIFNVSNGVCLKVVGGDKN